MTIVPFRGPGGSRPKAGLGVVRGFPPTIILDLFAKGYVEAALHGSSSQGRPFALDFDITHIAAFALRKMRHDCASFQQQHHEKLKAAYRANYTEADAGRDFWLTRNQQAEGFWSRAEIAEPVRAFLTQAAQEWPPYVLTLGPNQDLIGPR